MPRARVGHLVCMCARGGDDVARLCAEPAPLLPQDLPACPALVPHAWQHVFYVPQPQQLQQGQALGLLLRLGPRGELRVEVDEDSLLLPVMGRRGPSVIGVGRHVWVITLPVQGCGGACIMPYL